MSEPVLVAERLTKTFPSGDARITVLDGCDLALARGEMLAVVGSSGVGKSTLLHLLGGLDRPDSGRVLIEGRDLAALGRDERAALRNRRIGFVFQFHHLLREFTAEENVMMPFLVGRVDPALARRRARAVLDELGLADRAHHLPVELSGGERQRVALARAIAPEPAVVLADEPTGSLDPRTAEVVFETILKVQKARDLTVIVVTHAQELADRCDRIAHLTDQGRFAPEDTRGALVDGGREASGGASRHAREVH